MARRKSVCVKWTLVFLVVIFCPFVYTRPQDLQTASSTINSVQTDKTTENPIRYRYRLNLLSLDRLRLPIVIGLVNNSRLNSSTTSNVDKTSTNMYIFNNSQTNSSFNRQNRMISKTVINGNYVPRKRPDKKVNQQKNYLPSSPSRKPMIRKVVTKWTDKTNYEDLNFSTETSTSAEKDSVTFTDSMSLDDYSSTENIIDQSTPAEKRPHYNHPNKYYNKLDTNKQYDAEYENSDENLGVVHSNKVHIIEYPFPSVRPAYIFTTPKPTPIITNVGNPKPWSPHKNVNRKTTQKPVRKKPLKDKYSNYHNNVHNYPQYGGNQFEVTTFQPSNAYTERIVIRPEEYSASNDCPTVYLTLNNTFQGQGKEACPDLNIAVNTNVINKNVVVESEEGSDDLLPGGFGLPFGEDSEGDDAAAGNEYLDSDEDVEQGQSQAESASVEATGLSNYNANLQPDSEESYGGGSPNGALSGHKPGKPNNDDDFSLSGLVSFFKPAINAMTWLAAINPFSFTVMSILLTPIVMLIAGYSGVAALFAPLGLGREASTKIIHVYKPKWEWDDKYKTWYLNSFPDNRRWRPSRLPRNSKENEKDTRSESVRPTLFFKFKEWMKDVTKRLRAKQKIKKPVEDIRKNKRKKRETWTRRVK